MNQEEAPDCTERCRSIQHGDIITAAISRRNVSDLDLCAFLNYTCTCCESVKDSVGRTALHVAASCGRVTLVRWLIQKRHANINAKDEESGFTPLHRSIFYGKLHVAVELIKLGANTSLLDSDNLSILEHAMLDGFKPEPTSSAELYVWGSNCNNSLGPQSSRTHPELMDAFHKKVNESVKKVCVEKFHSVILTSEGKVYTCGHGQGGRLGLGTQQTVITPELVVFPLNIHRETTIIKDVAISKDHSVFLSSEGTVFTCGMNTHHVLGCNASTQQLLVPTQLKRFPDEITGVLAGQYHSVAWGRNCLYTWGLNAGQLGHKTDDKYISKPKTATLLNLSETHIVAVDSSDGAISVYSAKGDIYVLHEYQCRKIASRQLNLVGVSVFGGNLNFSMDKEISSEPTRELKVIALTNTGNLLLWQESDNQLCRCIYSLNRPIIATQVSLNVNGLLIVTSNGEAFQGFIKPRKRKTETNTLEKNTYHKFLSREDCVMIKITKFPRIHRAISIQSDAKGNDFCVIQTSPYKKFSAPNVMPSEIQQNFELLLRETNQNDDLHDMVLKVKDRFFPVHKCVISAKTSYFDKAFATQVEFLEVKGCEPLIFGQFLLFVYTGECQLFIEGECDDKFKNFCEKFATKEREVVVDGNRRSAFEIYSKTEESEFKSQDPVRMLHELAKKLHCEDLCKIMGRYEMHKFVIRKKQAIYLKKICFNKESISQFCDVVVKCSDGQEVKAHKCILSARTEYFNNLFSTRWSGITTSKISLPCPKGIIDGLLEYLYTDTLSSLNNKDPDHLFKLAILADQLFITRLKEQCQFLLYSCLTLKNCIQFLSLADIYNAKKLKDCALKFIVSNIAPLLELNMFDELEEVLLQELGDFYFKERQNLWCRVITPYSIAPIEEVILSISSTYPVSLEEEQRVAVKTSQKRRSRTHKSSVSFNVTTPKSPKEEEFILQFPDTPESSPVVDSEMSRRLKAIKLAEEALESIEDSPQFTKLNSSHSFEEFPLLSGSPSGSFISKTPQKLDGKHKMFKLSQKQRKRLSSENSVETPIDNSPKNPWKTIATIGSPASPETRMSDIISSERKQKENLVKITTKLLIYTQMEDKAIEDLCKFYNIENATDEFITIGRAEIGAVAAPVWVPKMKKLELL